MLSNISNSPAVFISHARLSRPYSATHHQKIMSQNNSIKKTNTSKNKIFKHMNSHKQNNSPHKQNRTDSTILKTADISLKNTKTEIDADKKNCVVVIEMNDEKEFLNWHHFDQADHNKSISQSHINNLQSVLMNPDKILLPVKQYSNKFLRQKKQKAQLDISHSLMKPKKSFVYMRKEVKRAKKNYLHTSKYKTKQNYTKTLKTQLSHNHSELESSCVLSAKKSNVCLLQTDQQVLNKLPGNNSSNYYQSQCLYNNTNCTPDKNNRISTSRALQMFSKVYKNEGIQRMRIRKQVILNKTTDVQVKQMTLQDKISKQHKNKLLISQQLIKNEKFREKMPKNRQKDVPHKNLQNRKKKNTSIIDIDDENFELVGW